MRFQSVYWRSKSLAKAGFGRLARRFQAAAHLGDRGGAAGVDEARALSRQCRWPDGPATRDAVHAYQIKMRIKPADSLLTPDLVHRLRVRGGALGARPGIGGAHLSAAFASAGRRLPGAPTTGKVPRWAIWKRFDISPIADCQRSATCAERFFSPSVAVPRGERDS